MTERVIGILDADSIAYKAAAANEVKSIKSEHKETGIIEEWENRTAFKKYLETTDHTIEMYNIIDVQEARHISYGKTLVRDMIETAKNRVRATEVEIYISGNNNFRDFILLPQRYVQNNATKSSIGGQYKSNREDNIRPVQLKELRQYMKDELGAIQVNDREVDDMSSIRAYTGAKEGIKIVQHTEDKDAGACHGWLLNPNWKNPVPRFISGLGELTVNGSKVKGHGRKFLYYQVLAGDKVDGYRPVDILDITTQKAGGKKVTYGDVSAYKAIVDCKTDKECWQAIYDQYKAWYPEEVRYTAYNAVDYTLDAVGIMQLYVDCAHMQRWENDRIDVRAVLTKLEVL